jgi:hypothetical protein
MNFGPNILPTKAAVGGTVDRYVKPKAAENAITEKLSFGLNKNKTIITALAP